MRDDALPRCETQCHRVLPRLNFDAAESDRICLLWQEHRNTRIVATTTNTTTNTLVSSMKVILVNLGEIMKTPEGMTSTDTTTTTSIVVTVTKINGNSSKTTPEAKNNLSRETMVTKTSNLGTTQDEPLEVIKTWIETLPLT